MLFRESIAFAPFVMVVIIMLIMFSYRAYLSWLKYGAGAHGDVEKRLEKRFDEIGERIGKIEHRLANLETIVLEEEKHKSFERLL